MQTAIPRSDADVEYLFLEVWPDRPEVSDGQNCGNMLAADGPSVRRAALLRTGRLFMRGEVMVPASVWSRL